MDKAVQFPPISMDSRTTLGSMDHPPALVEENADHLGLSTSGLRDSFINDMPAHSSAAALNLPSFNAMNENIRKGLPACTRSRLPDLKRSKINFEGKTCVREFIIQVEEYFLYKNFDESLLVGSFSDLLSGSAAKWFRTIRFSISSWNELKVALLKRFDKLEFDYFLEYDLRTRKQKLNESLPDFITELMDMASRLSSPVSESVIITIAKHNMLSIYTPYVLGKTISSLECFINLGKELEVFVNKKPLKDSYKSFKVEKIQSNAVNSNEVVCLKCKSIGHTYKNCSSIPGIICFKCRKLGVITKFCDVCNLDQKNSAESKN